MPRYIPVSTNAAVIFGAPDSLFHPGFWQANFLKEYNEIDPQTPNTPTITSPGGGELIGSRYFSITWIEANPVSPNEDMGTCVCYSIDYSIDDGLNWTQAYDNLGDDIICRAQGTTSVIWDLGAVPDTTRARIRICVDDSYGCYDACVTSNPFTITGGSCF